MSNKSDGKEAELMTALELTKRGYECQLSSLGTRVLDMWVIAPSSEPFAVQVISLKKPNAWLIGKYLTPFPSLYYIFVCTYKGTDTKPRYFITHSKEVKDVWDNFDKKDLNIPGLNFSDVTQWEDAWDSLPK